MPNPVRDSNLRRRYDRPNLQSMGRVLVVDDDQFCRGLFEESLSARGFAVDSAANGFDAQALCSNPARYDCVLADYRMPGMDGIALLSWIRTADPTLSTVIVTAEGEKRLVERTLENGACSFLNKPVHLAELYAAVSKATRLTNRQRRLRNIESAAQDMGRTQKSILESQLGSGCARLQVCMHPRHEAGGDFISRFELTRNQYLVLATDVSGHDLKAAFISAYFHGMARGMLEKGASITEVLRSFNQFLVREWNPTSNLDVDEGLSASLAVCSIYSDPEKQELEVSLAGSPMPVILSPDGGAAFIGDPSSHPLGWFAENPILPVRERCAPGSRVYLWTDGLEEVAGILGVSALSAGYSLLESKRSGAIPQWLSEANDDVMFVSVATCIDEAEALWLPLLVDRYGKDDLERIDDHQAVWSRSLSFVFPSLDEQTFFGFQLACREAVINALEHGCRAGESAQFEVVYCPQSASLRARVEDPGLGHDFDWRSASCSGTTDLADASRGLALMDRFSDSLHLERRGTRVTMEWHVDTSQASEGTFA